MLKRIIRFLIICYYKKHNELLAWTIPVDDQTDINILVGHYYEDHWSYGTKIYEYKR